MAHYAYLDENNVVTQVIVGKDEGEDGIDWEQYYEAPVPMPETEGLWVWDEGVGEWVDAAPVEE